MTATSVADPNKSASSTVDVLFVQITPVSPASATVHVGETAQYAATVTGAADTTVNWSLGAGSPGTISSSGLHTPPASIAQAESITVTAKAAADPARTSAATIDLVPVVVAVASTSANLRINEQQQFTESVTGHPTTAVTWSLGTGEPGSISPTGLYTVPSSIASAQAVTVTVTSVTDPQKSASATVTLEPVVVSVSPSTASLQISEQQQFTASVAGHSNTSVSWSLGAGDPGTISATGLYTAPASIASQQNIAVIATSVADPNSDDATVTLIPVQVTTAPSSVTLSGGQSQQFTATATGTGNTAVTWSMSPSVGTLSAAGLYTAPSPVVSPQTITVTATSVADPNKSAISTVNLEPVQVTVSPSNVNLKKNESQQFTATVTFATDTAVTWSMPAGSPGTLSASGLYMAPSNVPQNNQEIPITATSNEDPTRSASGRVKLKKGGGN